MLMISVLKPRGNGLGASAVSSCSRAFSWGLIAEAFEFAGGIMNVTPLRLAAACAAVLAARTPSAPHGFGNFDRIREV